MKKFISIMSSMALLCALSAPAYAAIDFDTTPGVHAIDVSTLPTVEALTAHDSSVDVQVEKADVIDDLTAWAGIGYKLGQTAFFASNDYYKVTYTVKDINELINGFENTAYSPAYLGLYATTVYLDIADLLAQVGDGNVTYQSTTAVSNIAGTLGGGISGTEIKRQVTTGVESGTTYPALGDIGAYIEAPEVILDFVLRVPKGTTAQIPVSKVYTNYVLTNPSTGDSATPIINKTDLTDVYVEIGEAPATPEAEVGKTDVVVTEWTDGTSTQGVGAEITIPADVAATKINYDLKATNTVTSEEKAGSYAWDISSILGSISDTTVGMSLNIQEVPADIAISINGITIE